MVRGAPRWKERQPAKPRPGEESLLLHSWFSVQKLLPFHSKDSISQLRRFSPPAPQPTPVSPRCHFGMSGVTELQQHPERSEVLWA